MVNKKLIFLSLLSVLVLAAAATTVAAWRKARRALEETEMKVKSASVSSFSLTPVAAAQGPAGLLSLGVRADFRSFAPFEGDWMICNGSSLFRFDAAGQLMQTWRVGLELPAFPLTGLTVRRGIPQPELWVATDGGGALIWDGRIFRQLLPKNPRERKVTALLGLTSGRMLVGTLDAGLFVTDARGFALFHPELRNVSVTALAEGSTSEEIWIGTRSQGAWLWRAGTLNRFTGVLPDEQVLSLATAGSRAWVGTPTGVSEFAGGQFQRHLAEGVFARALAETGGTLWISTVDEGTLAVDLTTRRPRPSVGMHTFANRGFNSVALFAHPGGVLALGADVVRRLPDGADLLSPAQIGLTNGHITALNIDSQGRLWIGYFDRGLDVLAEKASLAVRHFEDDILFCVNRIKAESRGGRTFVATANGLAIFDDGARLRRILKGTDGLISSHVTDIVSWETRPGSTSTAIATSAGVTFLNGQSVSSVYAFQGLVNNHVCTLAQSGPVLIAGTLGGVSVLKNNTVQASFTTANSRLLQNWITGSAVVGDDVYLGTYGSGVVRMDSRFEVETFREFSGTRVEINQNAMLATETGIFAGTAGQGLAYLPAGQRRWHFWQTGLPSANVTALAAGGGILYVGTDNGLVRVPERAFTL